MSPLWLQLKKEKAKPFDLLLEFGIDDYPVNVFGLAQGLGVVLYYVDSVPWDSTLDNDVDEGYANIYLNKQMPPELQRFAVAHSLGHLMLHEDNYVFRDKFSENSTHPKELEASQYATDLLMPEGLMDFYFAKHGMSLEALARHFQVSKELVSSRIKSLYTHII